MGNSAQELQQFAEKLQNALVANGFIVHRYDAVSTNSIYLKVDYGVGNSIRVSDHKGKQHLQYRYNVNTLVRKYQADRTGEYPRFYYPIDSLELLMTHILEAREQRIRKYGKSDYNSTCLRYKQQSTTFAGFWQYARQIGGK